MVDLGIYKFILQVSSRTKESSKMTHDQRRAQLKAMAHRGGWAGLKVLETAAHSCTSSVRLSESPGAVFAIDSHLMAGRACLVYYLYSLLADCITAERW